MKIYLRQNVFDAALDRIRYLFDEFENICVGFSGGKDSTVCLNLTLQVAEEKGRLPVKCLFLDQEAEWQNVIDFVTEVMQDERVEPWWFQIPLKIFNSTSTIETWLQCWEPGKHWIREKVGYSIKINRYGTDRFAELFTKIPEVEWPEQKTCYISGVRCEESPGRALGLTSDATYKHITYGKRLNKKLEHYTIYPLYDWSYSDVWKAIHDNGWPYCKIYDFMYQYGVQIHAMRVSNVHHETAVHTLFYLQEIEPETWNRIVERISGINTAGQLQKAGFFIPKELPYMFADWKEYRDYLAENILTDEDVRAKFRCKFERMDQKYGDMQKIEQLYKLQVNSMLTNDYFFTKLNTWQRRPEVNGWRKWKMGQVHANNAKNPYITG